MSDFKHKSGAIENEEFANSLNPAKGVERNWIVTIRFYSLLHYVDEILKEQQGYTHQNHTEREDNIVNCPSMDGVVYNYYRTLSDLSRDARYECHRMQPADLEYSEEVLNNAKDVLGFNIDDSSTKYST